MKRKGLKLITGRECAQMWFGVLFCAHIFSQSVCLAFPQVIVMACREFEMGRVRMRFFYKNKLDFFRQSIPKLFVFCRKSVNVIFLCLETSLFCLAPSGYPVWVCTTSPSMHLSQSHEVLLWSSHSEEYTHLFFRTQNRHWQIISSARSLWTLMTWVSLSPLSVCLSKDWCLTVCMSAFIRKADKWHNSITWIGLTTTSRHPLIPYWIWSLWWEDIRSVMMFPSVSTAGIWRVCVLGLI